MATVVVVATAKMLVALFLYAPMRSCTPFILAVVDPGAVLHAFVTIYTRIIRHIIIGLLYDVCPNFTARVTPPLLCAAASMFVFLKTKELTYYMFAYYTYIIIHVQHWYTRHCVGHTQSAKALITDTSK